jgi:hypothetical protein
MKIYTHLFVDLDAVCSVWAARKFIPGASEAQVAFKAANWDGAEAEDDDIIVDINASSKGLKGVKDADGTVHSATAMILDSYANEVDQKILENLLIYVDVQDSTGQVVENIIGSRLNDKETELLSANSLTAIFNAVKTFHSNDSIVIERMSEIFDGILEAGRAYRRAEIEADAAEIIGNVAIVRNSTEYATNGILMDRGIRVVVFVDGFNMGLVRRNNETLRMDVPAILEVIRNAGEDIGQTEWFAHPAGFLLARGTRKAPSVTPSAVDPRRLAEVVASLLA